MNDKRQLGRTVPRPPRYAVLEAYLDTAEFRTDTPAMAVGRALLMTGWERLLDGTIECIDVHLRSGRAIPDIIALQIRGPIADAATMFGAWNYAFAIDEVSIVRCVDFGRFRG